VTRAQKWDLADLTLLMLATGCRIGEALAVGWDEDLNAGTVDVRWHLVRVLTLAKVLVKSSLQHRRGAASMLGSVSARYAVAVAERSLKWVLTLGYRARLDVAQRPWRQPRTAASYTVAAHVSRALIIDSGYLLWPGRADANRIGGPHER
jgi:integrase